MAQNKSISITHTEILARAAQNIEAEIRTWEVAVSGNPEAAEIAAPMIGPLREKLEAVKTLYRIETGTEY
ncbi:MULTISPECIES: hypothetical protein [Eubacteriales]|uniref:hypothetical protein n=1 Tax=Eubacteriales TaxID=186802 RepID=UPI0018A062AF|nr:hypothetical protein [Intestinimonas butyriciproducens]